MPLAILYEDEDLLIVDKPMGLVVHPAYGHTSGTLVNGLLAHAGSLPDAGLAFRPGIVHRLDKDTSGLLVVGKTVEAVANLQEQLKDRTADKRYTLLVHGRIGEDQGLTDRPIGREHHNRQKMSVRADVKPAQTSFQVLDRLGRALQRTRAHARRQLSEDPQHNPADRRREHDRRERPEPRLVEQPAAKSKARNQQRDGEADPGAGAAEGDDRGRDQRPRPAQHRPGREPRAGICRSHRTLSQRQRLSHHYRSERTARSRQAGRRRCAT